MEKTARNIIKSNDVKLEGSFTLNVELADSAPSAGKHAVSAPTQVRIVEKQSDFAVLEITCSCGTKSYIRCEYTNVPSAANEAVQTKTNEENNNAN